MASQDLPIWSERPGDHGGGVANTHWVLGHVGILLTPMLSLSGGASWRFDLLEWDRTHNDRRP